jgi:UDP-N-acetylglucosamine acyltransferase
MGSVITKDVPPYVTVDGHPAAPRGVNSEGLRRRQFGAESIAAVRRAYRLLYMSGLKLDVAVAEIQRLANDHPELSCLVDFIAASDRSVVR